MFRLDVAGVPVPQGSKRAFRHSKTGRVVMVDDNPALAAWRGLLSVEARRAMGGRLPAAGPVRLTAQFFMPRPGGHFGTGRNSGQLKGSAPLWPAGKPDLDKLLRAVFDSLTVGGVWADDARCVSVSAWKCYADVRGPGVVVEVTKVEDL